MARSKAGSKRKKPEKIKMRTVTLEVPADMSDVAVRMAINHAHLLKHEMSMSIPYPSDPKEVRTEDLKVGTVFPKYCQGTTSD